MKSIIQSTDSYKFSHYRQYPPNAEEMSSYISARTGEVVFFGLQALLYKWMENPVAREQVEYTYKRAEKHGVPFNYHGFIDIARYHGGMYPVEIQALPEGTIVPTGVPMVQIRNTDPRYFWLGSFLETQLLRGVWYPSTVATVSRQMKEKIYEHLVYSSDDPDAEIDFKLHDFGARGASSEETASIGGMAHLVNFKGTDTFESLDYARDFYGEDMAGFSIPAAEHSTVTSWGKEGEVEMYRNILRVYDGYPLVAVVSDSYNIYNAVANIWGGTLRQQVLDSGKTVIIRPDSGDPVLVNMNLISVLWDKFGGTVNKKGFKVLDKSIRLIQGDKVDPITVGNVLSAFNRAGFSASNIAFGMGGALLQKVTRDDHGFAMKASEIVVDGEARDIYKDPVDGGKTSKRGRQAVVRRDGVLVGIREDELRDGEKNELKVVWRNGHFTRDPITFSEVRRNAWK